jgi:hypothetical protein
MRWAKEHLYFWLVLGPMVLGMTYFSAARVAENLPPWRPSPVEAVIVATLFVAALLGLSLSRASAELYHIRRPESYFDALGVGKTTHFGAALAIRLGRTAVIAVMVLAARKMTGEPTYLTAESIAPLICFIALTATTEIFAALNWIHWGHTRNLPVAIAAAALALAAASVAAAAAVAAVKTGLFSNEIRMAIIASSALMASLLFAISYYLNKRWRGSDMEYAKRLQLAGRMNIFGALARARRFSRAVAAGIARDLQLTLRGFSSAVYVASLIACLWPLVLVAVIETGMLWPGGEVAGWLDATWLPAVLATKFACVLMTATLASLVPVLVAYELPMMWVERVTGATGLDLWQAKLWYGRAVSSPAPLVSFGAGLLTGEIPLYYAVPALAECALLWWLVSSIMGGLAFEVPARPGLSIIVMATVGLAAGLLSLMMWLVGMIIYVQAMHSLTDRGRQMARYYLITEED